MATPPYVSRTEADDAVERITQRRREIDDPHQDQLTDNPADMPGYLRRYTTKDTPDWVKKADAEDGLRIKLYLWWELESFELYCLDQAHNTNVRSRRVGAVLGISSRAGIVNRRDRLRGKLGPLHIPDEKLARADRAAEKTRDEHGDPHTRWLHEHQDELGKLIGELIEHRNIADNEETYESLLELARDKRSNSYTGVMMWSLDQAITGLPEEPKFTELPAEHPLRASIARGQALLENYMAVT